MGFVIKAHEPAALALRFACARLHTGRMGRGEASGVLRIAINSRTILLIGAFMLTAVGSVKADSYASQVSAYRRSHGLPPVRSDPRLNSVALKQARAMASSGAVNHTAAGSFPARVASLRRSQAAENVAAGNATFAEALKQWQDSPGHRANLLMAGAKRIGIASAANARSRYRMFWAMVITD
jgi:uncharacterized protein YkwD